MGRAPCCEKMGLKKGPWTQEEDQVLIDYINQNGHGNWRALPKLAGLLRCGKSCRLRWMNYLRPDIKRGNFTREEEETIIQLHQELGNRWSVIAAKLPGRTDNEIKNVWNTHLKKKLNNKSQPGPLPQVLAIEASDFDHDIDQDSQPTSPQHSLSQNSCSMISGNTDMDRGTDTTTGNIDTYISSDSFDNLPKMDEDFWSEVLWGDDSSATSDFSALTNQSMHDLPISTSEISYQFESSTEDDTNFWYNLFTGAKEISELPEF